MPVSSKTNDHAEPNYWMVWLALAVLTAIELVVARVPNAKAFVVFHGVEMWDDARRFASRVVESGDGE